MPYNLPTPLKCTLEDGFKYYEREIRWASDKIKEHRYYKGLSASEKLSLLDSELGRKITQDIIAADIEGMLIFMKHYYVEQIELQSTRKPKAESTQGSNPMYFKFNKDNCKKLEELAKEYSLKINFEKLKYNRVFLEKDSDEIEVNKWSIHIPAKEKYIPLVKKILDIYEESE